MPVYIHQMLFFHEQLNLLCFLLPRRPKVLLALYPDLQISDLLQSHSHHLPEHLHNCNKGYCHILFLFHSLCLNPVFFFWCRAIIINDIILYYHWTTAHICTNKINSFFYKECIVIHMCIRLSCWVNHTA